MLAKEPDKPDPKSSDSPPAPSTLPEGQKPPRKPIDEKMVALLRAGVRRRRPWTPLTWLIVFLFLAVPIGLAVWCFWPRPEPPNLVVAAFDTLVLQGEKAVCRGQLEPVERDRAGVRLGGHELVFEEQPPGPQAGRQAAQTTPEGHASVKWVSPAAERFDFLVRYVQPDGVKESVDRGRVFAYPKGTKLLLVDVAALTASGAKLWEQEAVTNLALLPGAGEALQTAQRAKFAVVYLAVVPSRGTIYCQVRNQLKRQAFDAIPDGPVLGRLSVAGDGGTENILALLKHFDGPAAVIVKQTEAGEPYRAAGIRTLTVAPDGLGWKEVAKELAK
jgi:hypothetical protein